MNEDEIKKETEKIAEKTAKQIVEKEKDTKKMLIMVAAILGIFLIAFVSFKIFYPRDKIVTIDDLHRQNIEGEPSENNYMYNGYSFVYVDGIWYTQVQSKNTIWDVALHFGPNEVENITASGYFNIPKNKTKVYITYNPIDKNPKKFEALGGLELGLNMVKSFGVVPIAACDRNKADNELDQIEIDKACKERPIMTCDDNDKPVIYLKQEEPTHIEMKGNCVVIQGKEWDLIKAIDKFILVWYGIMEP